MKQEISEFLSYTRNFSRYSASTVKHYERHLHDFMIYVRSKKWHETTRYDIKVRDITDYVQILSTKKINWSSKYYDPSIPATVSEWTISIYVNSLIAFFKWLGVYGISPCIDHRVIPRVRVSKPKIDFLTDSEVREFIDVPERVERRRDAKTISMLFESNSFQPQATIFLYLWRIRDMAWY